MGWGFLGGVLQSAVGYWRTFITRKIACRTILSLLMLHLVMPSVSLLFYALRKTRINKIIYIKCKINKYVKKNKYKIPQNVLLAVTIIKSL